MIKLSAGSLKAEAESGFQDVAGLWCIVPPSVDRIWLWVCYNKIPIYPIFYLLRRDTTSRDHWSVLRDVRLLYCL